MSRTHQLVPGAGTGHVLDELVDEFAGKVRLHAWNVPASELVTPNPVTARV